MKAAARSRTKIVAKMASMRPKSVPLLAPAGVRSPGQGFASSGKLRSCRDYGCCTDQLLLLARAPSLCQCPLWRMLWIRTYARAKTASAAGPRQRFCQMPEAALCSGRCRLGRFLDSQNPFKYICNSDINSAVAQPSRRASEFSSQNPAGASALPTPESVIMAFEWRGLFSCRRRRRHRGQSPWYGGSR